MKTVRIVGTGSTPLIMHSDTLSDPLSAATKDFKKISGKRAKTDDDHEALARMEYEAGLYLGADGRVVIPLRNLTKCLIEGARVTKSGAKIERGVVGVGVETELIYSGPRTPADLYKDGRFVSRMSVRVGTAKTMRVRPIFREWGFVAEYAIDPAVIDDEHFLEIATTAGSLIGLGDFRKGGGFGRFTVSRG